MKGILLCSHNPLLIKNLYGILRDAGYVVETADHPARAVQMFLNSAYDSVLFDSEPFGLSAQEAVQIIKTISPEVPVMVTGNDVSVVGALSIKTPVDLQEFKEMIHQIGCMYNISRN